MSSTTYTILRRIDPPDKCYLSEVLLWRAFGRFPEILFDNLGKDWRFESDTRDGFRAPIPGGFELTEEECRYSGLPDDPMMTALLERGGYMDLEEYERLLAMCDGAEGIDQTKIEELKIERAAAVRHFAEVEDWEPTYHDYVDQFQTEICLKLRRGELRASGTRLPDPDPELTIKILENSGRWLSNLDVVDIEKECWISQTIDWQDSAIYGHSESFIWIHVNTEDMLQAFPPRDFLKAEHVLSAGISFAVASSAMRGVQSARSPRGRPSLPWQEFHVEVARMFRDSQMPTKKEAAIALIQEWFLKTLGKNVSRAAVGERLKPYFDSLIKK